MLFFGFFMALFITIILIPLLISTAPLLQLVDVPGERKIHTVDVPRVGGLAMFVGAIVPILMWTEPNWEVLSYLIGATFIVTLGVWDDRRELNYQFKFLGQIIGVLIVIFLGNVKVIYFPFLGHDPLPDYVAIPFTAFALLGITNAINLADGLDGLAGGTTLLSLFVIALLAYLAGDSALLLIALALVGSILGFLRYNTHPARLFMGDAGSQFLGFSAGVLVVLLTQKSNTALSPMIVLLILGLPIFDTLAVMTQRIREGRSPFSPDKNHLHHKLLNIGISQHEAVVMIYGLQAVLVTSAYLLRYQSDGVVMGSYLAICLVSVALLRWARLSGWRMHAQGKELEVSWLSKRVAWLRADGRLAGWTYRFLALVLIAYVLAAALFASNVEFDIGLLAFGTLAILVGMYPKQHGKAFNWLEKTSIFIACVMIVYLVETSSGMLAQMRPYLWVAIGLMAVGIVISVRMMKGDRFRLTSLDFLMVLLLFVLPNLPGTGAIQSELGFGITSMVILFYTIEMLFSNIDRYWDIFRWVFSAALLLIGVRIFL